VAITAPCAFVAPWASVVIGLIAGALVCWSVEFFDKKAKVDDPCGAISVHGMCGAWGLLAVGLFADGTYPAKAVGWNGVAGGVQGIFYGGTGGGQLLAQAIDVVVGFIWAWGVTYLIFIMVKKYIKFRVSPEVEIEGLDEGEFGQVCYPDFVIRAETDTGITHELDAEGANAAASTTRSLT
jgi:Amt family ammonium transporter